MIKIPLRDRHGVVIAMALIDDEDAPQAEYRWHRGGKGYARRRAYSEGRWIYLHRVIIRAPNDRQADHINGDRLDNRRGNLRLVTAAQQGHNQGLHSNSTSGYRGVSWHRNRRKWVAGVRVNGKKHFIGSFNEKTDAAEATRAFREANLSHTNEDRSNVRRPVPAPKPQGVTTNTSGHRGVTRNGNKWMARVQVNRKRHHLGSFEDPADAAEAVRVAKGDGAG
jgi:HNH endonuclease/AP2 domain